MLLQCCGRSAGTPWFAGEEEEGKEEGRKEGGKNEDVASRIVLPNMGTFLSNV